MFSQKCKFQFERIVIVFLRKKAMKIMLVDTFSGFQTFMLVELCASPAVTSKTTASKRKHFKAQTKVVDLNVNFRN